MSGRRLAAVATILAVVIATTACASTSDRATQRALAALAAPTTSTSAPPTTAPASGPCTDPTFDPTASFRPTGPLPSPGQMPPGTFMRTIFDRGRIIVGVDENTKYFSYRDPISGAIVGFEPDLAREIARAMFGDPTRVEFVSVVTDQKVPFVERGLVDATISVVSASCDRWQQVAFTTTYYETTQRILVRADSTTSGIADLAGHKVCVTLGSSSQKYIAKAMPAARVVPVETRTDCLVALQEGRVDAILLPNSILAGLHAQDPTTKILDELLQKQSYGIPISASHPEFVQFVNSLLERWRADGTLAVLQDKWLPQDLRTDPAAPAPRYRDQ
jgi:polar amino acid transport system substrate-binding protein